MQRRFSVGTTVLALVFGSACENKPEATTGSTNATAATLPTASAPAPATQPSAVATQQAEPKPAPPAEPPPEATPPPDALKTKSGLAMVVLAPGSGKKHPKPSDVVRAKFTGYTQGSRFGGAEPQLLTLSQQPPGWAEALAQMVEGEKRRIWMPAKLAYGNAPGGPSADLILDLELLAIPEPPKAPPDVKQPPADATKLPSGVAYKILSHGSGSEHPTATSRVTMHYTGWTKAGKMFDSSVLRGAPLTIGLNQVIRGWQQAVPMMVVGDKMRLWIPALLAYGDKPARPTDPAGALVFDLELLGVH